MPADMVLVVRCPYCVSGIEFRPMIAYEDGRFVCRECGHTARPGDPDYRCSCRKCIERCRHGRFVVPTS